MSPLTRAVRLVLWLIAASMIVLGALFIGLELAKHQLHKTEISVWRCLVWSVPMLLGAVLFVKGTALARRLTDDFEE
jgi:hypothetical protein